MARKKKEEAPAGSPAWMATFSDLMNLLLCFFVLLFSMSTVDAEKFQVVIASLQSRFSVLQGGASSIGDGEMVGAGINQLQYYDTFYNPDANSSGDGDFNQDGQHSNEANSAIDHNDPDDPKGEEPGQVDNDNKEENQNDETLTEEELQERFEEQGLEESEEMAEEVEEMAKRHGIQDQVEVQFNAQYVMITLSGAVLFDSGKETIRSDAMPLVEKVAKIVNHYTENIIEVEGHTDSVPISNSRFEDNNVLSMYRALSVADFLRENTRLSPSRIKSSGRGDYVPIADNTTPEGRALNRRVVIKIYNTLNSRD